MLSIVVGIGFAFIAKRFGWVMAMAVGALVGLALYVINFYGMTAIFPWFAGEKHDLHRLAHCLRHGVGPVL